jgi:methyl coenzyme M reductase alpha subunit
VIIVLGAVVFFLLNQQQTTEMTEIEEEKRNVVVNNYNAEEFVEEMLNKEYVEPGYYNVSMNNVWHFADSSSSSEDAVVENKDVNTNDVYFDVFLAEDEETPIIKSPVIPRGAEIDDITLDTPLAAGTYDCIMVYHLIDENQDTISTLRVGVTIIVES